VGRPALVQQRSSVLAGQARRSGAAIPYRGFAQFEAALDLLDEDPGLGDRLGAAGRRYVEAHYAWPDVLSRYERLLATTARR
jgi:glycosyltransferase involved in cell wall biosynthesis